MHTPDTFLEATAPVKLPAICCITIKFKEIIQGGISR